MNGTPTMKTMLKDMFEFLDSLADILDIEHDESLEKLKKKSNNQFLQFNIFMMMTVVKTLLEDKADTPCNHCHQELQEENEKLKEQLETGKKLLKESKEWNDKAVEEMEKIKKDCCSKEIYDSVCKENQELLEEIKELKEQKATQMIVDYGLTGKETKEELIEKIKTLHQSEWNWTKLLSEERAKNVELQKELKRSKELFNAQPLVKQIEKLKIKLQNREEMMKDRIDERDTFEKSLCKAEQEVKKQKEVVKQLQKFQADENDAKDIRCVNKIAEEVEKNRKLTKENKYLKEEIERLNSS